MGLLDEAIREHLELKRRRGGDPTVIAAEEREALEPVFPDEPPPASESALAEGEPYGEDAAEPYGGHAAGELDLSIVGQETAELDMQTVLAEDARQADQHRVAEAVQRGGEELAVGDQAPAESASEEDPLEWEVSGDPASEPAPEPLPGQERLSFE
ncbi:MAG: hypothetical protein ACLQBB_09125 [Solirubrobacteraceae bacterium]